MADFIMLLLTWFGTFFLDVPLKETVLPLA
jgi:hypothetical protein